MSLNHWGMCLMDGYGTVFPLLGFAYILAMRRTASSTRSLLSCGVLPQTWKQKRQQPCSEFSETVSQLSSILMRKALPPVGAILQFAETHQNENIGDWRCFLWVEMFIFSCPQIPMGLQLPDHSGASWPASRFLCKSSRWYVSVYISWWILFSAELLPIQMLKSHMAWWEAGCQ